MYCSFLSVKNYARNLKKFINSQLQKNLQIAQKMATISNRDLRISIVTFYNLNRSKGKNYTLKHFSSQIRAKIYHNLKYIGG